MEVIWGSEIFLPSLKRSESIDNERDIPCLYRILDTKVTNSRTYALVKFSLPDSSTKKRKETLEKIIQETGSIGLMEWWTKGSIVHKPRSNFYGILVFRKPVVASMRRSKWLFSKSDCNSARCGCDGEKEDSRKKDYTRGKVHPSFRVIDLLGHMWCLVIDQFDMRYTQAGYWLSYSVSFARFLNLHFGATSLILAGMMRSARRRSSS